MRIIPAILAHSMDEFTMKVEHVRPLGQPVHIDVMDGKFVDNTTWARPQEAHDILKGMAFEVHLMVTDPYDAVLTWCKTGAARVFFHVESGGHTEAILERPHNGCHTSIALNPETGAENIPTALPRVHDCLVMGVQPGWSGQTFDPAVLEKIRLIKAMNGKVAITVDGGVNLDTIASIRDAGADAVVMGSALTDADDIRAVWDLLAPYRD